VRLGLLLRRHAGVERHVGWIHTGYLPPTCCVCCAPAACRTERSRGAGRRVMGTTRSYACTTQAVLTRLGSNVRRTSRGLLGLCARRATLLSLLPWRRVLRRLPHLQRGPEKPVPIAGAQLCPWNARRELYQKIGNFVGSVTIPPCGLPLSDEW
jgi:hypothetical protein